MDASDTLGPAAKLSDVVLPVLTVPERNDLVTWSNYVLYTAKLGPAVPDAMNDADIYIQLANLLGFGEQITEGNTPDQWMQKCYSTSNVPLSWEDFKKAGYYKFDWNYNTDVPPVVGSQAFYSDPVKNPLPTPSGKIEVYSPAIVKFFGSNNLSAPPIPKYIAPAEYTVRWELASILS